MDHLSILPEELIQQINEYLMTEQSPTTQQELVRPKAHRTHATLGGQGVWAGTKLKYVKREGQHSLAGLVRTNRRLAASVKESVRRCDPQKVSYRVEVVWCPRRYFLVKWIDVPHKATKIADLHIDMHISCVAEIPELLVMSALVVTIRNFLSKGAVDPAAPCTLNPWKGYFSTVENIHIRFPLRGAARFNAQQRLACKQMCNFFHRQLENPRQMVLWGLVDAITFTVGESQRPTLLLKDCISTLTPTMPQMDDRYRLLVDGADPFYLCKMLSAWNRKILVTILRRQCGQPNPEEISTPPRIAYQVMLDAAIWASISHYPQPTLRGSTLLSRVCERTHKINRLCYCDCFNPEALQWVIDHKYRV